MSADPSRVGDTPFAGRGLGCGAVATALALYTLGFLSLGRAPAEALGIAVSHVAPAALAGWAAWTVQPHVRALHGPSARWIAHGVLALLFGAFWAGGLLGIARVFSPEVVPHLVREVLFWTGAGGTLVYALIAGTRSALVLRGHAAERDAAVARAELAALRARVEPHFLYNALESIAGLVRDDPDGAEEAIARLGRALRRLLDEDSRTAAPDGLVTLSEELETVRDTLFIERLRMGERLRVIERVEPRALDRLLPSLTLQPLVENAIVHGISPLVREGVLSIAVRIERAGNAERLVVEVADDGRGTDEARIDPGGASADSRTGTGAGVGLGHLRRRLTAHYRGQARLDVATAPGRGFSVRLAFPTEKA